MNDEIQNIDGEPCRPIEHKCKFCHKPIILWSSIHYPRDPYKLLEKACCNRCSDLRTNRRILEEHLLHQCELVKLLKSSKKDQKEKLSKARENLETLTKKYGSLIAQWHNLEGMAWESAIVDAIMQEPKNWGDIVSRMWRTVRT